jgi:hypothetical protein
MAWGHIEFTQSATSGSYIDGKIQWTANPVADGSNRSELKADFFVRKGNTTTTLTIPTEGTWESGLSINGGSYTTRTLEKSVLEDLVYIGRITQYIAHNADGTKTIDITGYIKAPTETSFEGHITRGSATAALDVIPRPTTIDSLKCSTSYLDGTITALYTPKYSGFYNQRKVYVDNNGKLTLIRSTDLGAKSAKQQTSTLNFSAAELETIYRTVGSATKATIMVVFKTFRKSDYSSQTGEDQYLDISLSIPQSVVPTVDLAITPKNSNAWIASKNIYVAGLSGANVALSGSAGTGAEITSRNIIYNGATYDAVALNITALKTPGNVAFTGKIVDSRGRTGTATESISVLPYSPPAVTSISIERGTYSTKWTADESGEDLRVTFKTNLSLKDNGNTYSAAFEIDGAAINPNSGDTTGLASGASCVVYFRGIDSNVSHTLRLTSTDSIEKSGAATITVPTAYVTIEFRADGKGIAFGKTSEKAAFECAMPAHFGDAVHIMDKITCPNVYSLRNFNINCNWADNAGHDLLVRVNDGLTTGLGWSGSGDDGSDYETVLDVRPKKANFRGTVTAPRGRFTATNDLAGENQNAVALRIGDETGQHIDIDSNEIQAKETPTTPGPLYLNLDGGDVFANAFRIPQIQRGSVRITPTAANTPTSMAITFEKEFSGTPTVIVSPYTAVPGTVVTGVAVNGASKTGCTIWVTRTNTTETVVHWIAIY